MGFKRTEAGCQCQCPLQCAWDVKTTNHQEQGHPSTTNPESPHPAHSTLTLRSHLPHPYCWHYVNLKKNTVCVCVCLLFMEIAAPVSTVCIPAYMERKKRCNLRSHLVFTERLPYCPLLTVINCDYLHWAPKSRTVRTNCEWSRLMDLGMNTMRRCITVQHSKEREGSLRGADNSHTHEQP